MFSKLASFTLNLNTTKLNFKTLFDHNFTIFYKYGNLEVTFKLSYPSLLILGMASLVTYQ